MPLITLIGGSLAYGHVALLEDVEFRLARGERVALIGRNGNGKSSLLAALAGSASLDDGEIWRAPGLKVGYVAQEPELDASLTVFAVVVAGMGEASRLLAEYHGVSHQLADSGAHTDLLLDRLHCLQEALEARGAWSAASRAERVIQLFGLDAEASVGRLSGGQKKRLALARGLVNAPDALLLDEPTNHLDIDTIAWLEDMLLESGATLIFITHDRRFLDRLATRIVELDRGRLTSFDCGFGEYQRRKEQMLAEEAVTNAKSDKLLREEEAWIRQGVEARRTRAAFRVQRLTQLRARRAERRERMGQVNLQLSSGERSGELVAELEGVTKGYGGKPLIRNFSCRILRGDRVGVIGPNGAGKTTLLKLILGDIEPDSGRVRSGTKQTVGYFDQFRETLDPEAVLADVISPGSDYVQIGNERKHVIGYLGDFLFAPQRVRSPVKSLSGGERNRLLLARLFARPANVLVLDEPTNDLDIDTLELLEQLLQDYSGTLFLVSHDRAFLDNVVTQVIAVEGDGIWRENAGGYDDWMAYRARRRSEPDQPVRAPAARRKAGMAKGRAATPRAPRAKSDRLSFGEERELETLPDRMASLEAEQKTLVACLEDPALYGREPMEARRVAIRLEEIERELLALLERWEALESRALTR
jgi:ATP-binding cassette subfamily F protein uup